ncbi:MAG: SH3 domain-containing protein, partial [Anaerolineales bacterium]
MLRKVQQFMDKRYNPDVPIRISIVVIVTLALWSTACGVEIRAEATPSQAPLVITSTFPAPLTEQPSETSLPPRPQPTVVAVEGMTSTQVNVRAEPSTASKVLGIIPANTRVEITGKDPGENWWQINYPQGDDGKGWVTAQYVTTASTPEVPIMGGEEVGANNGNVAVIQQQLNVRSGPGTSFNSLGTLNPQDVVRLTGKDQNGGWLQIEFPAGAGPDGKGWVNAAFVQAQGVENLPIITEAGQVIGTGTPTSAPSTPTPTLIPAWEDNDSPTSPLVSVIFESAGTQTLIYNGDLSSPQGDSQDWIAFEPYSRFVVVSLECRSSAALRVEVTENQLPTALDIACGDQMKEMAVKAGSNYLLHLESTS